MEKNIHTGGIHQISYQAEDSSIVKRIVVDSIIYSILDSPFRTISLKETVVYNSYKYYMEAYNLKNRDLVNKENYASSDFLKERSEIIRQEITRFLQCKISSIHVFREDSEIYLLKIIVTLTFSPEQIGTNQLIHHRLFNYVVDLSWGIKMKAEYPIIAGYLQTQSGFSWKRYYLSIKRVKWLDSYFQTPKKYLHLIDSLLHYFAGIDEIYLFDIVVKIHLDRNKIGEYSSITAMRYRLKKEFIETIPYFRYVMFDDDWYLGESICSLNSLHYLRLFTAFELRPFNEEDMKDAIRLKNIDLINYIIEYIEFDGINIDKIEDYLRSIEDVYEDDPQLYGLIGSRIGVLRAQTEYGDSFESQKDLYSYLGSSF